VVIILGSIHCNIINFWICDKLVPLGRRSNYGVLMGGMSTCRRSSHSQMNSFSRVRVKVMFRVSVKIRIGLDLG